MKNTEEHNRKISEGLKALHLKRTPEHKEAISQGQLRRWLGIVDDRPIKRDLITLDPNE